MLLRGSVEETVDLLRKRAGISNKELAARMGWPVGTLASYLHRMHAGREPRRHELDLLAKGLSDHRFGLGEVSVVRNHLYAAAGIEPTPEEVSEFLDTHFPSAPEEMNPCRLDDFRGFVRWLNEPHAVLVERLGGPPAEEVTLMAHAWVLAQPRGRPLELAAVPKVVAGVPPTFRLAPDMVAGRCQELLRRPVHLVEVVADPRLGLNVVFGAEPDERGALPPAALDLLAKILGLMEATRPGFRRAKWYGPVDRRLSHLEGYREALRMAAHVVDESRWDHSLTDGTDFFETRLGTVFAADAVATRDPRMSLERLLPAGPKLVELWRTLRP